MEELATVTEIGVTGAKQDNTWIFAVCVVAVILLGAVIAFVVSRARAKQTTAGILSDNGTFTVSDTEAIVRKSVEKPSEDILSSVLEEIEK